MEGKMSENNINEAIMDKLTKVCICNGISRASIKTAIKNGASTVEEVTKATGSSTGSCGGNRCKPKITELIEKNKM
jgi:NAD(P)H-nitrite reductase large subunit